MHLSFGNAFKAAIYVEGGKRKFSFLERVCFAEISGHWVKTLTQSGKLLRKFHQNCFFAFPVQLLRQEIFFKFQSIIIFGQFLGKITTFGEKFLAFIMFFAFLTKMFLQLQRNVWVNFSRKKELFFIWKFKGKSVSVLWWMISTGLSKLQSLCPSKHFEESLFLEKILFNIFFNWAMEFRLFVNFFQEFHWNILSASKASFWGEICFIEKSGKNLWEKNAKSFRISPNNLSRKIKSAL